MHFEDISLTRRARLGAESLEARLAPANLALANLTPTIAVPAAAVVNAAAKTAELSVLGADDGGEQNLRYTWYVSATKGGIPAPTLSYTPGFDGNRATVRGLVANGTYIAYGYMVDTGGRWVYSSTTFNVPEPGYQPPTVAQPAKAVVNPDGMSARLTVLGSDDKGEANLKYTWQLTSPSGVPYPYLEYSAGLKGETATARVFAPGTYTATARITDNGFTFVTSSVTFTVAEVRQPLSVSPPSKTVNVGTSFDFDAVYRNQFGSVAGSPKTPTTWTLVSGPGTVNAAGVFTAPAAPGVTVLKAVADGAEAFTTVVTRDPGNVPAKTSHVLGEQKVLVVQWVYADSPGTGNTPIDFADATKRAKKVDDWVRQQSFNKSGLNFTFVPVHIRLDNTKAHYQGLRNFTIESNEALRKAQALDPSFNESGYDRIWFATTPTDLGSAGKAYLGGKQLWMALIGGTGYHNHEFAHTYGVDHAHADYDIGGDISGPTKVRLGWLTPTDANGFRNQAVTAGGTFRLYDDNSSFAAPDGVRALQLAYGSGGYNKYTLSYSSYDKNQKLLIHEAEQNRLDTTPGSLTKNDWKDGGVAVGQSYVLPNKTPDSKTIRVTVLAAVPATVGKPAWLNVKVELF